MMLITLGNINPAIDRLIDITIEAVYTMQATDNHWLEHSFPTLLVKHLRAKSGTVTYVQNKLKYLV
jgi:hypothetical protein